MNTVFYFVRHRESEKNVLEIHHSHWRNAYPLTLAWKKQAEGLCELFSWKCIDVIYTSPFLRCKETIHPISQERKLTPLIDERISELDVWSLDRTPWRLSWDSNRKLTNVPIWWNWETLIVCRDRIWSFLDEIKCQQHWKTVMICSHGEPLLFAKQYFLWFDYDDASERDSQYPSKDGFDEFTLDDSWELVGHHSYGKSQI